MISPLNVFCWIGYFIWGGVIGVYLPDYLLSLPELQAFLIIAAGMLGVWLLMSFLFKGTSQDEDFEPEEDSEPST